MDEQVITLAKAIRQTESGGKFDVKGASGEYGAYQWMPGTWKMHAKQALGNENAPMTPDNQNAVAYTVLKTWKDQGLNPAQIAAKWNSGSEKNWENKIGVNKQGVNYNVPLYVKKVTDTYQQFKGGSGVSTAQEESEQTLIENLPKQKSGQLEDTGSFGGNVVNSAKNLGEGLLNIVKHPIDTLNGIGSLGAGAFEKIAGVTPQNETQIQNREVFDGVVDFFRNRYGGNDAKEVAQNIGNTAYTDPVGFLADLSTVVTGAGGAVSKVGNVSKTAGLVNTGSKISRVGEVVNPISLAGKSAGRIVSKTSNLVGRVVGEGLGISTGAGFGAIKEGLAAAKSGGEAGRTFREALRGGSAPEEIVQEARNALDEVVQKRRTTYQDELSKIADNNTTYDISPIHTELDKQMTKFNIGINNDGALDFSRSSIRFNKPAQSDIQTIYDEMQSFGLQKGDRTAIGIDNLKKAFGDLYTPSGQGRAFVEAMRGKTREILSQVNGYDELSKNYENASGFIEDITKNLSLGEKVAVETSFKKLTSALRQNNEFRKQIIADLDEATGGKLMPKIAGQQLSPIAPRGLARLGTVGAGGVLVSSGAVLPLLVTIAVSSPRLIGELLNALGFSQKMKDITVKFLNEKIPSGTIPTITNVGVKINDANPE